MGKALIRRREGRANRRAQGPVARGDPSRGVVTRGGHGTGRLTLTLSGGLGTGGWGEHRVMVEGFKFGVNPDEGGVKGRGFIHRSMNVG